MDLTQVVLGLTLLAIGAATFASPAVLDSSALVSVLAIATLGLAGTAFLIGTSRRGRLRA